MFDEWTHDWRFWQYFVVGLVCFGFMVGCFVITTRLNIKAMGKSFEDVKESFRGTNIDPL